MEFVKEAQRMVSVAKVSKTKSSLILLSKAKSKSIPGIDDTVVSLNKNNIEEVHFTEYLIDYQCSPGSP